VGEGGRARLLLRKKERGRGKGGQRGKGGKGERGKMHTNGSTAKRKMTTGSHRDAMFLDL
jgi:hypothetical protein